MKKFSENGKYPIFWLFLPKCGQKWIFNKNFMQKIRKLLSQFLERIPTTKLIVHHCEKPLLLPEKWGWNNEGIKSIKTNAIFLSIIHNWTSKSYPTLQIQVDICLWQFMLGTSSLMPFNLVDWIHLFCTSYIALKLLHLGILLCLLCAPTMHLSSTDEDTLKVISDFSLESAFAILFQWDKLKERYFLLDKKYLIFIFPTQYINFFVHLFLSIWLCYIAEYKQGIE